MENVTIKCSIFCWWIFGNNARKYNNLLRNILHLHFKGFHIYFGYSTTLLFMSFIGSILIFSMGVFEIYRGNLTVGALFVFDSVSERFYQFARDIVNINIDVQSVVVATDRINSIFDLEGEDYSKKDCEFEDNSIEFKNVSFKYDELAESDSLKRHKSEIFTRRDICFGWCKWSGCRAALL